MELRDQTVGADCAVGMLPNAAARGRRRRVRGRPARGVCVDTLAHGTSAHALPPQGRRMWPSTRMRAQTLAGVLHTGRSCPRQQAMTHGQCTQAPQPGAARRLRPAARRGGCCGDRAQRMGMGAAVQHSTLSRRWGRGAGAGIAHQGSRGSRGTRGSEGPVATPRCWCDTASMRVCLHQHKVQLL